MSGQVMSLRPARQVGVTPGDVNADRPALAPRLLIMIVAVATSGAASGPIIMVSPLLHAAA
jgi:hypothetical protein